MRRCLALLLAALVLALSGCAAPAAAPATELSVWVTSEENARIYGELAEKWNEAYPDKRIDLETQVYSSQRIAAKLSRGVSVGTSFSGEDLPDLVEIDYATFPRYVFQQTTDLYPLKNILSQNTEDPTAIPGISLYSSNDICFGLPYHGQELVLCYRLDLEKQPGFRKRAASFESLAAMGADYYARTGESLLWVDYLGSETFLALFTQALQASGDPQQACQAAEDYLRQTEESGASGYLPSGDAYAEAFPDLMARGAVTCLVTTRENLCRLAQEDSAIGQLYGVLPLPSFSGERCTVTAPTVAACVLMSGEHVVLARDFLAFCRFSDAAADHPAFDLTASASGAEEALGRYYKITGDFTAPAPAISFTAAQIQEYLTNYSRNVLGIE